MKRLLTIFLLLSGFIAHGQLIRIMYVDSAGNNQIATFTLPHATISGKYTDLTGAPNMANYAPVAGSSSITQLGTIGTSPYTTAGIIHNIATSGAFTSSLIVNADITPGTIAFSKLVGTDITSVGTLVAGSIPYSLLTGTPSTSIFNKVTITAPATSATITVKDGTTISNLASFTFDAAAKVTLVSGTKAITITGITSSSIAVVSFVSAGGTITTTTHYAGVCTANTLTITALTSASATDTSDTSTISYIVVN